ncbi:transposase family protein [Larkinella bovis]|uniref:Transposase family protein n=1 Tax=Larkinella bovis TaxID=683041 RepID=A0ABW0I8D1_9BACT
MDSFALPFHLPDFLVSACQPTDHGYRLVAYSTLLQAACPCCGQQSRCFNGFYRRDVADLPSCEAQLQLQLFVRRFRCANPACRRRTFSQVDPAWLKPQARRTNRLALAQLHVAMALGWQAGSQLLTQLHMPTSRDTLLRLIRHWQPPASSTTRIVGVDDWAIRKAEPMAQS